MTRLLSSLMSDSEVKLRASHLPTVYKTEKKTHEGSVKKTWKRSLLGSTQLEVRLLREQRGKVRFAQGLRQKAQQRHQTRLWGCQTISDHVSLGMPCFPGFSQLIPHGQRPSQGLIGGVGGGHIQQQWRPGVPLFNLDLAGSKNITG